MAERSTLSVEKLLRDGIVGCEIVYSRCKSKSENDTATNKACLIRSCTAFHNCVESSFDKVMIPFPVPFLRKSASFTLLMKASWRTFPSASSLTSCSSGHSVKCSTNFQGRGSGVSSEKGL